MVYGITHFKDSSYHPLCCGFILSANDSGLLKPVKVLVKYCSEDIDTRRCCNAQCYVICCFRYELDDPEFVFLTSVIQELTDIGGNGLAADYLPFLKYFPSPAARKAFRLGQSYLAVLEKHLNDHRQTYSPGIQLLSFFKRSFFLQIIMCHIRHGYSNTRAAAAAAAAATTTTTTTTWRSLANLTSTDIRKILANARCSAHYK